MEGLESTLANEIASIGGIDIKIQKRAVEYSGDKEVMYKSNYLLRTALRILMVKKEFVSTSEDKLYNTVYSIPWESFMTTEDTFAIDCTANSSIFRHSKFAALRTKDAIADRFVKRTGLRPNVNVLNPTYRINLHIREDQITIALDSSGESLHMRGDRINTVDAPLNEVLAAGVVLLSGWKGDTPLLDPMCGSGTILMEAAKIATNRPPQKPDKTFGFMKWKSFDSALFQKIVLESTHSIKSLSTHIIGYDKNLRAVKVAQQNIIEAKLDEFITVEKEDFFKSKSMSNLTIISNPPYDERLKEADIKSFYRDIGEKMIRDFEQSKLWIISANISAVASIGLEKIRSHKMDNGGLPARLVGFKSTYAKQEIYEFE